MLFLYWISLVSFSKINCSGNYGLISCYAIFHAILNRDLKFFIVKCLLVVYKNDSFYFDLVSWNLCDSYICSNIYFQWIPYSFLYIRSCHLQIKIVLLFSFLILMTFISFSCPIVLARISSTILNRSWETENASLVPDLVKASGLSPLSVMLAAGFS